jgi:hypothetical protein
MGAYAYQVRYTQTPPLPENRDGQDRRHNGPLANYRIPERTGAQPFPNFGDTIPFGGVIPRFVQNVSPAADSAPRETSRLVFNSPDDLKKKLPDYGVRPENVEAVAKAIYDAIELVDGDPEEPEVWAMPYFSTSDFQVIGPDNWYVYVTSEGKLSSDPYRDRV